MLAWEGVRIHQRRGDARRLLLARLVLDHRLGRTDAFAKEASDEAALGAMLLGDSPVPLAQAAAHLG
jgi:acyl-CoA dehydrogenase